MIPAEHEIQRYNQPPEGIIALLIHVGQTLYNRLRNIIVSAFTFPRRDTGGGGDISTEIGEKRESWVTRIGRYLCSSFIGDGSTGSLTEGEDHANGEYEGEEHKCTSQTMQPCSSTTVTIGSSIPSGSDLFERESDIEYFYPDPAFVLDGPPSETEANIVHKSISQNLFK